MTDETGNPDEGMIVDTGIPEAAPAPVEDEAERQFSKRADKRINDLLADRKAERIAREAADRRAEALEARLMALETERQAATTEVQASRLEAAKRAMKAARDQGDTDAEIAAMADLAEASVVSRAPRVAPVVPQPAKTPAGPSAETQAWIERNDWFTSNTEMNSAAQGFERVAASKGLIPGSAASLKFIESKVRTEFPEHFADDPVDDGEKEAETPAATRAAVAAAPRRNVPGAAPSAGTQRQIRLSSEQLAAAKMFKLTPQQYAASLAKGQ